MFEKAARMKLRFQSNVGALGIEDLWDLSVDNLDSIYGSLSRRVESRNKHSLLKKKSAIDEMLDLQANIVEHILVIKVAEAEAREVAMLEAADRQETLGIIAEKKAEAKRDKSIEELQELVN